MGWRYRDTKVIEWKSLKNGPAKSRRVRHQSAGPATGTQTTACKHTYRNDHLKPQEQRTRERFSLRSHLRALPSKAQTTGRSLWLFDRSHPHGNRSLCFSTGGICTVSLFLSLSRSHFLSFVSVKSGLQHPDRGGYLKAIGKRCHLKKNNKKPKKYKKTQDWSVVLWSLLIICVLKAIGRSQDSLKRRLKWEKIIWSLQGCRFVLHKSLYPFPLNCEGGEKESENSKHHPTVCRDSCWLKVTETLMRWKSVVFSSPRFIYFLVL